MTTEYALIGFGDTTREVKDSTETRVDVDEQILGSYVADGVIVAVLDEAQGVTRVATDLGDVVTATIDAYYTPMPRIGSRVRITKSAGGQARASILDATYPSRPFVVHIRGEQNPDDASGYHTANGDMPFTEFGTRRVLVTGAIGLELNVGDAVICVAVSGATKAVNAAASPPPLIFATSKLRNAPSN